MYCEIPPRPLLMMTRIPRDELFLSVVFVVPYHEHSNLITKHLATTILILILLGEILLEVSFY